MKTSGYFVAVAALGGIGGGGCGDDGAEPGDFSFPEGVASGDPRESSVVLWTRVQAAADGADLLAPITVIAQVSDVADFSNLVVEETLNVTADSDHTLRLVVTGLSPATRYYYRFVAGVDESTVGRTLTAPPSDDTAPVRLAWVSCQDYGAGMYGAYRELIKADEARPESEQIQFVVHLGDFIYETVGDGFQSVLDDRFEPMELYDLDGNPRLVEDFPSGGGSVDGTSYADTLDDYRHLYKQFLRDPDLQAARARWPFVCTWDDHEFTNDAWQTQANYIGEEGLNEPSQTRKVAANQAWFEFIPAHLTGVGGVPGVPPHAFDFVPTEVDDVAYTEVDAENQITEPNNLYALASLGIYRSLRYGQNVELVITDQRSYRSDHPIPEEMTYGSQAFFDQRNAVPLAMNNIFDAGMMANGGDPPPVVLGFDNPRMTSPPGTMLGPSQKQWFKDTMVQSDATWKIWGNEVPLMRVIVRDDPPGILLADRIMSSDAWDGYNYERNELMQHLRDNNVDNVVVISGDIHAHFAGLVMDDHDQPNPQPVAAEFVAAGIASNSLFSFYEDATREQPFDLRRLVTYDSRPMGGDEEFVENLNILFRHGKQAAIIAADTHDIPVALAASDPLANPQMRYVDSNAQGFGLLTVTATGVTAELVTVNRPVADYGVDGPGIKRTATFTLDAGDVGGLAEPEITGTKPFPLT